MNGKQRGSNPAGDRMFQQRKVRAPQPRNRLAAAGNVEGADPSGVSAKKILKHSVGAAQHYQLRMPGSALLPSGWLQLRDRSMIVAISAAGKEEKQKAVRQLDGLFSRENSSNGGSKNHQNFLEKILWAAETQCQGIFPE